MKEQRISLWIKRGILFVLLLIVLVPQVYGFSFVVLGDSRNGRKPAPIFVQMMEEISLLRPDFVIHTGDWVYYPTREGWQNFLEVMKIGKVPFYLVVGGHEIGRNWRSLYREMIRKDFYYAFKHENCSFIILCCYEERQGKEVKGRIDPIQFKWLEKELERARKSDFIFVFVHKPLYPVGYKIGRCLDRYPESRDSLVSLFRKYKEKLFVFCGHEHLYNKTVIDGLTQIITGGAGASLHAPEKEGGFFHYLYVTVEDKEISMAVIKPGCILMLDLNENRPNLLK